MNQQEIFMDSVRHVAEGPFEVDQTCSRSQGSVKEP